MTPLFRRSKLRFNPLLTAVVVGIWVVLIGVLLADRYLPGGAADITEGLWIAPAETDDWFLIRIGGTYSGYGSSRQFRREDKWALRDDLNISLNLQGQIKPIRIFTDSTVDEHFRLISFRLKISSGIISFEQKGRMEGRDLLLEIPASQGGGTKRLKLYESPRISRSLGLPVPLTGLQVGEEIRLPIFDPMDGNKSDSVIRVLEKADLELGGKKVEAWRVRASLRTLELTMWIDNEGRLLKGRMPLGITVTRSDKAEIMKEMHATREIPDMISLAAVPLEGSIPESDDLKLVRLQIQGGKDWPIPSDQFRQTLKKSEIVITKEILPESTYTLPCKDPEMEQYLAASRFIRSDHEAIVQKAKEIVGGEKDPIKAAGLINKWVFNYLKKVPTASVPDAYTVLQTKQGACNEHAVLAVSLARAAGLPAQIAVGLIHADDCFYYHAWAVYWAGRKWFTGDPLMNRLPVGPSYVTLLYGDVEKHANVVSFLGQLKLKVLEAN
ncbi:MAG: transglutaminase-like domain-containing protein [Desulfomonilaceae bacterium]